MTIQEIEARRAEIAVELETEGADLDALEAEVRSLADQEKEIREKAEADAEKRAAIAQGLASLKVEVIEEVKQEERKEMNDIEIRNSKEYIDAFAKAIKTGDETECRALLTENATGGTLPVPEFVYETVSKSWEDHKLLAGIKKTFVKGVLKIGVETANAPAVIHAEGGDPVPEEELEIISIPLIPQSVKKWVAISDEALDLTGEIFLRYIYEEIAHQIATAIENAIVTLISTYSGSLTLENITGAPTKNSLYEAMAKLAPDVEKPVLICSRGTWGAFMTQTTQDGYPIADPLAGMDVIFTTELPTYSTADPESIYALIVDLNAIHANFPNGEDIQMKYDDVTLMAQDLVRILGRVFVGFGFVKPYGAVQIFKPTE